MSSSILNALKDLLSLLIDKFGPDGALWIVAGGLGVLIAFRIYRDYRASKAVDRALAEKERTIQRLADQERTWRRVFLQKGLNLDAHRVDKLMMLEEGEHKKGKLPASRKPGSSGSAGDG